MGTCFGVPGTTTEGCKVRQGLTSGDVCEKEYSLFFCLCVVSRTGLYFLFPAVFLLPLVCPPVSPFPRSLSLLLGGFFFSLPTQLVCLSLLQKHEHIVEMCGACNSEQVRMREGGEGEVEGEGEDKRRWDGSGRIREDGKGGRIREDGMGGGEEGMIRRGEDKGRWGWEGERRG